MELQGKAKEVIDEIHEEVQQFARNSEEENRDVKDNHILAVMCSEYDFTADEYSRRINDAYGYNTTEGQIIRIMKLMNIFYMKERNVVFQSAQSLAEAYSRAITGSEEDFAAMESIRKNSLTLKTSKRLERIAPLMIYHKYPELDPYDDMKILIALNKTFSRIYFYKMYDALCHVYGFPMFIANRRDKDKNKQRTDEGMSREQAVKRVEELEIELETTKSMLGELQEEFDNQLKESKIIELTDFFSHLNSDRYGNILDQLLQLRRGIEELRKANYELPLEINGLFIIIKQLIQFTRDRHIEPIMKLRSKHEVTAKDIEFCDYEGSPFESESDIKTVEVISPGWVYKDHDVRISRPRLRECEE